MSPQEKILQAYAESKTYPELVEKLVAAGVQSYTVDVVTGITLFRFAEGMNWTNRGHLSERKVNDPFSKDATVQAIRNNQQGKTTYPQFMEGIAIAGVRFYEATLQGKKRVTYIGAQGEYEEEIPF